MADWPTTLPNPLSEGYSETPPNIILRTEMDSGIAKIRRRYTAGVRQLSLSWLLTKTQVGTVDTFYVTTTLYGSLSFNITNPRTGTAVVARFKAPPDYSAVDINGRVSVKLEILP